MSFSLGGLVSYLIYTNIDKIECLDSSIRETYKNFYNFYDVLYKQELNVEEQQTSHIPIQFRVLTKMGIFAGKLGLVKIEQYLRQNCVKSNNVYILTHNIEGKTYKFIVKPKRGPTVEDMDSYILGYSSIMDPEKILNKTK